MTATIPWSLFSLIWELFTSARESVRSIPTPRWPDMSVPEMVRVPFVATIPRASFPVISLSCRSTELVSSTIASFGCPVTLLPMSVTRARFVACTAKPLLLEIWQVTAVIELPEASRPFPLLSLIVSPSRVALESVALIALPLLFWICESMIFPELDLRTIPSLGWFVTSLALERFRIDRSA